MNSVISDNDTGVDLYDLSELRKISFNDPSFLPGMAKLFIETVPPVLTQMRNAANTGIWKEVGALAHKLKATIDTMHISALTGLVREIEKDGKQEASTGELSGKVMTLVSTMEKCIDQLKEEFSL